MADYPDIPSAGLDREAYLCVVVPGIILGVGTSVSGLLVLGIWFPKVWSAFGRSAPGSWLAGAALLVVLLVLALALGYANQWLSGRLYRRAASSKGWAWPRAVQQIPETLPYCALAGPSNQFYLELKARLVELAGPLEQLHVVWNGRPTRHAHDVVADLMAAWYLAQGSGKCEPGWTQVQTWWVRSNFSKALATAFPISIAVCSLAASAWLAHKVGWVSLLAVVPSLAIIYWWCRRVYGWFVVKAVAEWVEGGNALSRLFWAAWGERQATSTHSRDFPQR